MKSKPWRLIDSGLGPGDLNMALDGVLTDSFLQGHCGPMFRLYQWAPGALSLGRFQDLSVGVNRAWLKDTGTMAVRRMTGGGAIFHTLEMTYSLVCREEDLEISGVKASFEKICSVLISAYKSLGLEPRFAHEVFVSDETLGQKTPVCFAGRELFDIVVGGRKVGGNAQRRLGKVIFQHGSIPLQLDWPSLRAIFEPGDLPKPDAAASLEDLGVKITPQAMKKILTDSFEKVLNAQLILDVLTPLEHVRLLSKRNEVLIHLS